MIRRLILENFMAHRHTEIPLDPGLTVLTGPNNTGKSAVVEALRCLATNPVPKHFIRHGAKKALVTAELDDGTLVTWGRKEKHAWYEILRPGADEPEEFYKFGRRPPEEVTALLRLDPVQLEEHNIAVDVHLGDQRKPVFLLDLPGSAMASFFAASSESSHLLSMQKLLKKKVADRKREAVEAERDMRRARSLLDTMAPLPSAEMGLEHIAALLDRIRELDRDIPILAGRVQAIRDLSRRQELLRRRADALSAISAPPLTHDIRPLGEVLRRNRTLTGKLSRTEARRNALAGLSAPPALPDTRSLARRIGEMRSCHTRLRRQSARRAVLLELKPAPPATDTSVLAMLLKGFSRGSQRMARITTRLDVLRGMAPPPETASPGPLTASLGRLLDLGQRAAGLRSRKSHMDERIEKTREAIAARLEGLGVCPLCRQPFKVADFLEEPHGTGEENRG